MNPSNIESSVPSSSDFTKEFDTLSAILTEMSHIIVGQEQMCRCLLMGLICDGHVLLEGLPGLAKTLAVKTLANVLDAKFQRIQFTPDLLPSDLIGTLIYNEVTHEFVPKKGPIFTNILLADEINRSPAKVQSALLEAMAEKQVTIGETTYRLEEPFLVLATQNPIEQEGTYPLPEAQLDRFMFKIKIEYPSREEERKILERMTQSHPPVTNRIFSSREILQIRKRLSDVHVDERIREYIVRLVTATRRRFELSAQESRVDRLQQIRSQIYLGASPRASIFLSRASRAQALLEHRNYVIPDDIKAVAKDIFRHRLILTFEADARNLTTDEIISEILETVFVP